METSSQCHPRLPKFGSPLGPAGDLGPDGASQVGGGGVQSVRVKVAVQGTASSSPEA